MTEQTDLLIKESQSVEDGFETESDSRIWSTMDSKPAKVTRAYIAQTQNLRRSHLLKTAQLIWLATMMLEFLFLMRFVLRLMDANPSAGFAVFVYDVTALFLAPFLGLTVMPSAGGAVLEIPTLIAMLVYAVWAWLIVRIIWVVFEEPPALSSVSVHSVRRDWPQEGTPGGY